MRLLSTHNRVLVVVGGLGLAAALAVGASFVHIQAEDEALDQRYEAASVIQNLIVDLSGAARDRAEALPDYLLTGDPEALARYQSASRRAVEIARQVEHEATAAGASQIVEALAAVTAATEAWQARVAGPAIAGVADGRSADLGGPAYGPRHDAVRAALERLTEESIAHGAMLDSLDDVLTGTRTTTTSAGLGAMIFGAVTSLWFVRRYGRALEHDIERSGILNRFTEATNFAPDDRAVAVANLAALDLLAHPDSAVSHVLNASRDRAVPEATMGRPPAEVLPLNALSGCPGVVRGSIYVTPDAAIPLSVQCPVYPVERGTLACIPLAHGETVGAVHLHWEAPNAFPLELRASVARVAEHAALAVGNRRLLALLEGQAGTDARTGLANSRTFDAILEKSLAARLADDSLAVLLLDLDHFKDFNDRHGHPAGDEALRAFAGVLGSCMRSGDVAARYGGEEFAVLLPDVDETAALAIAERIRSRTESAVIALGPGISERITVSIGVAMAPLHASDRVSLLQIADAALYRAKDGGRNQVRSPGHWDAAGALPQPGADEAFAVLDGPPGRRPRGARGASAGSTAPTPPPGSTRRPSAPVRGARGASGMAHS